MAKRKFRVLAEETLVGGKGQGEVIELDDEQFNIPALIEGGFIEEADKPAKDKE